MADTPEQQQLQAKILSHERRIAQLEATLLADTPYRYTRQELLGLYIDARYGVPEPSDREARLWASVVSRIDETGFLDLAYYSSDPFPWRPFLGILDSLAAADLSIFVYKAQEHLISVAENLLRIQGLGFLRPEDVLLSPLGVERALSTYQHGR